MAGRVAFSPQATLGAFSPATLRGSAAAAPSQGRAVAPQRDPPAGRVSGNGTFRFPVASGVGRFRVPLLKINLPARRFSEEAPAPVALRMLEINPNEVRGAAVDVIV